MVSAGPTPEAEVSVGPRTSSPFGRSSGTLEGRSRSRRMRKCLMHPAGHYCNRRLSSGADRAEGLSPVGRRVAAGPDRGGKATASRGEAAAADRGL